MKAICIVNHHRLILTLHTPHYNHEMEHAPLTQVIENKITNVKCITGCQISALSITDKSEVNYFRTIICLLLMIRFKTSLS